MTGSNISGIAKNVMQIGANLRTDSASKESMQDFTASFMAFMSQSNLSSGTDVTKDLAPAKVNVDTTTSYTPAMSSVTVKEAATPEKLNAEVTGKLEDYADEVKEVLKEELGVTEEEIESAMETLGLSYVELMNPQNLTALVQTLTGEDVGTLFLSESFQTVMEQVSVLTEELCAELGITKEALAVFCEDLKQMTADTDTDTEAALADVSGSALEQTEEPELQPEAFAVESFTETQPAEQQTAAQQILQQPMQQNHAEEVETEDNTPKVQEPEQVVQVQKEEEMENFDEGKEQQSFSKNSQNLKSDTGHVGVSVAGQQTVQTEEFIMPQEVQQHYSSQLDAMELIEQIARNVRVTISAETTSMEMQLNPENLGKIFLNISEKEGAVRAQLAAQNEAVKEALESQIVELRQSLHQQGVKVDAIEVTVATHEFEQNLEQNARQEEQMQQQREETEKQARRNLNLNDLDGLSGLMTEEENLVAKIMRDNGNQVDLTA